MNETKSKRALSRACAAALMTVCALTLAACDKADNQTVGEKVDAAAPAAEASLKQGANDARDAIKDAGAAIAGSVDDATITAQVSAGLAKDPDLSAIKIDVDTKAGVVSLKGPAPTTVAKARAEEIARSVKGVTSVDNQLDVKM